MLATLAAAIPFFAFLSCLCFFDLFAGQSTDDMAALGVRL